MEWLTYKQSTSSNYLINSICEVDYVKLVVDPIHYHLPLTVAESPLVAYSLVASLATTTTKSHLETTSVVFFHPLLSTYRISIPRIMYCIRRHKSP